MSSAVISRWKSSTGYCPSNRKSSGSRCRVCPRERLVCPATSHARWASTRSGAVRRRSTRPFERRSDCSSKMANAKWRIVLAAIAATTLLVAAVLAYEIARRASAPAPQVAGSSAPTGSANPDSSTNTLALSVFEPPRPLPEIRFQDDQGHDLTLADFRGRAVLLNLWATWCVPCRQEMPTLDRLEARLGGKDFLVIALSIDRKGVDAVRDFYREVGVEKLAIYLDPSGKGSRGLAIPGVPTTLLIDQEGREVARKMGAAEWDGPETVSLIERTMRGQSASNAGGPTAPDPNDPKLAARGKVVYAEHCASCHGANLEGQSNWRKRLPNGRLPAPPHDATGHTWHHSDTQLFDMVKNGTAAMLPGYETDMPAYKDALSDADIWAVLSFIESTWPPEIRQRQQRMNQESH